MIVSSLVAAAMAAGNAHTTPPTQPHADHKAMEHGEEKMACCEKMAKGEGCDCCKGVADKAKAKAGSTDGHAAHSQ